MSPVRPVLALDRPIRSRRRIYVFVSFAWLWAAWMLGFAVLLTNRMVARNQLEALASGAFFLALAAAALWLSVRMLNAELRIGPRMVIVRNPLRRHAIALDEVEGFGAGNATPRARNSTPGIVVRLTSGRELPVWALAEEATIFSAKQRTERYAPLAVELDALLASARDAANATARPAAMTVQPGA